MALAFPSAALTRATALVAAVWAQCCCGGALALQARRPAASSESQSPRDLEDALMSTLLSASRLEDAKSIKIHVHFHKAGGSLMCNLAWEAGETTPMPEMMNCNWRGHDGFMASGNQSLFPSCAERHAYYKKFGLTYSQVEREVSPTDFCDGIKYSCLFRDPVDLIASNINFEEEHDLGPNRETGENASIRVAHMRKLVSEGLKAAGNKYDHLPGLEATVGWKFMDNMQTRLLSGAMDVGPGKVTRRHVELAKQRLAKFHAVAKLEDLKDPTKRSRFFTKMGWNVTMGDMPQVNPTKHVDRLSHADKLWLADLNKHDYELISSVS